MSLMRFCLFLCLGGVAVAQHLSVPKSLTIGHQEIRIRIDHATEQLTGEITIEFHGNPAPSQDKLVFDMIDSEIHDVRFDGQETSDFQLVTPPDRPADASSRFDYKSLEIAIPQQIGRRNSFEFSIRWQDDQFYGAQVKPWDGKAISLGQITAKDAFSSHVYYYPFLRYMGDSADLYFSTNLEDGFVISSGRLVSQEKSEDGYETFHYQTSHMSGLLPYPFAVARYESLRAVGSDGKTTLQILYFPEDRDFAEQRLAVMQDVFTFYLEIFGPYPFSALTITETEPIEGTIGLAAQSVIMLSKRDWFAVPLELSDAVTGLPGRGITVIADEINHQWNFYKVNSPNYLAEGISRYVDSLYIERISGKDALIKSMAATRAMYFRIISEQGIEDKPISDPKVFNTLYFIKGACALHMLRRMYASTSSRRQ